MSEQSEDWRKADEKKLRNVEQKYRNDIEEMEEFPVIFADDDEEEKIQVADSRTYVEHGFYDFSVGLGVKPKSITSVQCGDGHIPDHSPEALCILWGYKLKKKQGKRDPLAGNNILRIPMLKGAHDLPLHEVRSYALNLLRVVDSIEDKCAEKGIEMFPEPQED